MKRVLIVSYYYPPPASTGSLRISKLSAQLPGFGYAPIVLSTNRFGVLTSDSAQDVYRAGDWVQALFHRTRRDRPLAAEEELRTATVPNASLLGRLRDWLMVPDTKLGWLFPGVNLGRYLIEQYRPSALLSTSPPETAHLLARLLSRWSGLPWVADLRDGWVFEPPQPHLRAPWPRCAIEERLESDVVENASAVTTISAPLAEDLCRRYPQAAARVHLITNGYDRSEFARLSRQRSADGDWVLVHTGSLEASRKGTSAEAFFTGLALARSRRPDRRIRVQLMGSIGAAEQMAAQRAGVADLVNFSPPVSREQAHQTLMDADAALLVTSRGPRSVATIKLFDYIGAGTPVLALAEDNAAADIVQRYGLGMTVAPDSPEAVARGLEGLLDRHDQGYSWPGFAEAQARFEWQTLAGELARVLDHL